MYSDLTFTHLEIVFAKTPGLNITSSSDKNILCINILLTTFFLFVHTILDSIILCIILMVVIIFGWAVFLAVCWRDLHHLLV